MSFLTPLFLAGLAALAIPLFLHLIQKERKNVVRFPSLMFLRKIPYQSVQRRRIRHLLLLMARLAALALIVFAFARPFVRRADLAAAAAGGAREIVVLVDRSYSMGYGDRWERALAAARDVVEGMKPLDRASVVYFGSNASVTLRSTADKARLLATLSGVETSAGSTHYGPALKLAGSILSESALPGREAVLISDFQRAGWRGADGVRLPEGAALMPVNVAEDDSANVAVTPVSFERSTFSNQERITVTAGAVNHAPRAVDALEITLEIDGRPIQSKRVRLEPHGSSSATFDPVTLAAPSTRVSVRLPSDRLERDNVFHLVVSPGEPVTVVLVQRPGDRDGALYLSRALGVGEAPHFNLVVRDPGTITSDDLRTARIVLLNDLQVMPVLAARLAGYVQGGGGLLIVAGPRSSWPQEAAALVPAVPAEVVDRTKGQAGRLVALEYAHAIFEPFRAPRGGDFSAARFYGYRAASAGPEAAVLARFEDGSPALLERQVGAGRVLMWLSSMDLVWSDLPIKPVFLPFVHQMARHLVAYREPTPWLTVGGVLDPQGPAVRATVAPPAAPGERTLISPAGHRLALDGEGPEVVELEEQGFYELRTSRDGPAVAVASNVDLSESNLDPMDPRDVVAAATGRAGGTTPVEAAATPTDAAQEGAQRVWWYLLFAGLLLLTAETVLASRSQI
jgi:Mg-chelatase subunit ChlD